MPVPVRPPRTSLSTVMATAAHTDIGDDVDTSDAVLEELNETEAKHIAASIVPRFDPVDTKLMCW